MSSGDPLSYNSNCKFLGIHLDDKLTFRTHIDSIISKISKNNGILYRIRNSLPLQARLDFYHGFIYPYLTYNVIVWGGAYQAHLQPLIVMHKRVIRTICSKPKNEHTSSLFLNLGLLKFQDLYKYFMCIYMYRACQDGQFTVSHHHNTRNRSMAAPQFHRLQKCQHAVSFAGPTIWNKIPEQIRSLNSIASFKKALKSHLLNQYNEWNYLRKFTILLYSLVFNHSQISLNLYFSLTRKAISVTN